MDNDLIILHNSGFFSCCSVAMEEICKFYNENKYFPTIDRSNQFYWYKEHQKQDLSSIIYTPTVLPPIESDVIKFYWHSQFAPYKDLDYSSLSKLIDGYFNPSDNILSRLQELTNDISVDVDNIISVCYRGNDKSTETMIPSYSNFIKKVEEVSKQFDTPLFYLQTDEQDFADIFLEKFKNTYVNYRIPMIKKDISKAIQHTIPNFTKEKFEFSCNFLASLLFMSKTKAVITHSGNVGIWIALYRKNCNNLQQYLNGKWY
jgi:hypothetical protein